jgi:hypothetical protein
MVVVPQPISFDEDDPRPMFKHLDAWARRSLVTPEAWSSVLERCDQWLDYSPRNQVLLASYGVAGPVAGAQTWAQVQSSEDGRPCSIRHGEHGLPVRVPVVAESDVSSDRSPVGAVSQSVAGAHRWEKVFALEQLARHPAAGALESPAIPRLGDREWTEVVRVASGRLLGRTPRKVTDPLDQLASLAGRVPQGAGRVRLDSERAVQAAHVVAARVGLVSVPMPALDPSALTARERWQSMVDVRRGVGQVMAAVSFAVGVDLAQSPVPRHDVVDDRQVAPGRRNYLSAADVRALPLGTWIEAGPYTRGEWMARGVSGANGVAAFLRVNDRSYLAAYETRGGATWRLETTGRGAHRGLVGEGEAEDLATAKRSVSEALAERFPEAARSVESTVAGRVLSPAFGWVALPGGRDDRTQQRTFDDRVSAMVSPGPGGRWQTWVSVDGSQRQGPLAPNDADARTVADGLARGALMELAAVSPARANAMVRDLASDDQHWNRAEFVALVGHRLNDDDRQELETTNDPEWLVQLMNDVGVLAPPTMLSVLRAEQVGLDAAIDLVPALGMAIPDAIRQLRRDWDADRLDVGNRLGATTEELRAAGCTPTEMLAVSPREELRRLDAREQTWVHVGPSLLEAGYTVAEAVTHLAAHAPNPDTFAAGVASIVECPVDAFALAAKRAQPEDFVSLSERYELSPAETAIVLADAGIPTDKAVFTLALRCGDEPDLVARLSCDHLGIAPSLTASILDGEYLAPVVPIRPASIDITDTASLVAAIGPPVHGEAVGLDTASLLAALPAPGYDVGPEIELEPTR